MARDITTEALQVIGTGARYATRLTLTPPGGTATVVNIAPGWSVAEAGQDTGTRLSVSSLSLLPTDGIADLFAFAGYPGTLYQLSVGIAFGATTEWLNVFTGYVVEGSSRRTQLGVAVSLSDAWAWVNRVPFDTEYLTSAGVTRANTVAEIFAPVVAGLTTLIENNGGFIETPGVYTGSRAQAAANIAKDGLLRAGFNGNGELVIKTLPTINSTLTPAWTFRSEQSDQFASMPVPPTEATIVAGTLERTRPWLESLYNAVVVRPGGSEQTWTAQIARLADTADPRHEDYVGFRPLEISSETIDNPCDALTLAQYELTRILRAMEETVRVTVVLNPAIEKYDPFYVAALPTLDDTGWNGTYLARSVTHAPSAGTTTIEGISAAAYSLSTE